METSLSTLIPKFIALIEQDRGTIQPPVAEVELATYELRWNVTLPADMREFYATMNGTGDATDSVTDYLFRIWPLEEVRPIPNMEPPLSPTYATIEDAAHYLCFSDYLLNSDVYAIHAADSTRVITVYSGHRQVARNFTDFIDRLVTNFELLF